MRLRELHNTREEELATLVEACGLGYMTAHSIPRRRYRGDGRWTWRKRRGDRQVMGMGDCILCTNRQKFLNEGIREARMSTDHWIVLEVINGEGSQSNGAYVRRKICWLIKPRTVRPLADGEAFFVSLKGEVNRAQSPTKVQAPWISQETWHLADRRTALQITGRCSSMETIQARREFQIALQEDIRKSVQDAGTDIESMMETVKVQEEWVRIYRWYR